MVGTGRMRRAGLVIACLVAVSVAAACSSSAGGGHSSTTPSGTGSAPTSAAATSGVTAAKAFIAKFAQPYTPHGLDTPLVKAPPSGKTLYYVTNNNIDSLKIIDGIEAAASVLGWTAKFLTFPTADVTAAPSLMQQAIAAHPDFIGYNAVAYQVLQPQIAAAKSAGIPIFESYDVTAPGGPVNWLFSNVYGSATYSLDGAIQAALIVSHSGDAANTLYVKIANFPILEAEQSGFTSSYKSYCPGCKVDVLTVPPTALAGGQLVNQVIAYLRSHPTVNNVAFAIGTFEIGFEAAAAQAGFKLGEGGITVTDGHVGANDYPTLKAGTELGGVEISNQYAGWAIVDAMARYSVGMDLSSSVTAVAPAWLRQQSNVTSDSGPEFEGPTGYQAQFKTLWKVS